MIGACDASPQAQVWTLHASTKPPTLTQHTSLPKPTFIIAPIHRSHTPAVVYISTLCPPRSSIDILCSTRTLFTRSLKHQTAKINKFHLISLPLLSNPVNLPSTAPRPNACPACRCVLLNELPSNQLLLRTLRVRAVQSSGYCTAQERRPVSPERCSLQSLEFLELPERQLINPPGKRNRHKPSPSLEDSQFIRTLIPPIL